MDLLEFMMEIQSCNHGNNIVGLFDALPNFPFTKSEMKHC